MVVASDHAGKLYVIRGFSLLQMRSGDEMDNTIMLIFSLMI